MAPSPAGEGFLGEPWGDTSSVSFWLTPSPSKEGFWGESRGVTDGICALSGLGIKIQGPVHFGASENDEKETKKLTFLTNELRNMV